MKLHKLIPAPVRKRFSLSQKYAVLHGIEDIKTGAPFVLNPYRRRQAKRILRRSHSVQDYLALASRYLGQGALQRPAEIEGALAYLKTESPVTVCEIGVKDGGTTLLLNRILPSVKFLIGIDLRITHIPQLRAFVSRDLSFNLIQASSYAPQTVSKVKQMLGDKKLDVLFIDGDHNYDGVKQDFLLYKDLVRKGGFILFHDIVPDRGTRYGEETACWAGGVPLLWERIRSSYETKEFVADVDSGGYGIGVLRYDPAIELPSGFAESQDDLTAYPAIVRQKTC